MAEPARMSVDLHGRLFRMTGANGPLPDAIAAALVANGAAPTVGRADLLIVAQPLLPDAAPVDGKLLQAVTGDAAAMAVGAGGRIVFILSAMAGLPMRRHADYSAAMAAAMAGMRGMAMQSAPKVLVNAVGVGVVESADGELLSGDRRMLTHASLAGTGTIADVTDAVLFLCDPLNSYTTGQLLTIDGGWSAGFGRNF